MTEGAIAIAEPEPQVVVPAAAQKATAAKMFRFSAFVDLGPGAEECPERRTGGCADIEHFHAWIRMPNPLQHQDIREKALAAKARRARALKDTESDGYAVLEGEISQFDDPAFDETLIDDLLSREWAEDYLDAQMEVDESDEFAHIAQDREEFNRLQAVEGELAEDAQSEEYKQLSKHISLYIDAIKKRLEEIQTPKRERLQQGGHEHLITLLRARRIEEDANSAFLDTYNTWMWFIGTYEVDLHPTLGRPYKPKWSSIGHRGKPEIGTMLTEAPEVIEALKEEFGSLNSALSQASAGN